jgi:hypothetical protein
MFNLTVLYLHLLMYIEENRNLYRNNATDTQFIIYRTGPVCVHLNCAKATLVNIYRRGPECIP